MDLSPTQESTARLEYYITVFGYGQCTMHNVLYGECVAVTDSDVLLIVCD